MKRALITGITGQDGSYLAELLIGQGYDVFGLVRNNANLKQVPAQVTCLAGDLDDAQSIRRAVDTARPHEVYHLGGVTDLKTAFADPLATFRINYESVGILLDACLQINPQVRFLQASSSEIFAPGPEPLSEISPRQWGTKNPYADAKMRADRDFIAAYRTQKGTFSCSAFLFNHDSPRRSEKSALRKITQTLAGIKCGRASSLVIGNVEMLRDWGYAQEYAEAMWKMLQIEHPEDLVIASGRLNRVKDAIDIAAQTLGFALSWQGEGVQTFATDPSGRPIVTVSPELYKPAEPYPKFGDTRKAERTLGFRPKVDFRHLVAMMAAQDHQDICGEPMQNC